MKIGIASSGLWKLRHAVELMTGGTTHYLYSLNQRVDAIAGWGHKPTADRPRHFAKVNGLPYIAFEDGFLRSIEPGDKETPLSMVMDKTGIYYDSRQPSDLEPLIRKRAKTKIASRRTRQVMDTLRDKRLSKYNNSSISNLRELKIKTDNRADRVLVVDQTCGDASIVGAMANSDTFSNMLVAAVRENPGAEILVRVHPETMSGRKAGHFDHSTLQNLKSSDPNITKAMRANLLKLIWQPVNPWSLLEGCSKVYCVSSQLGFEGLMAGCEVHCFGVPFYAGWGLTSDRNGSARHRGDCCSLECLFEAAYLDYCTFFDKKLTTIQDIEKVIDILSER